MAWAAAARIMFLAGPEPVHLRSPACKLDAIRAARAVKAAIGCVQGTPSGEVATAAIVMVTVA